jgi:hypothetical protein
MIKICGMVSSIDKYNRIHISYYNENSYNTYSVLNAFDRKTHEYFSDEIYTPLFGDGFVVKQAKNIIKPNEDITHRNILMEVKLKRFDINDNKGWSIQCHSIRFI